LRIERTIVVLTPGFTGYDVTVSCNVAGDIGRHLEEAYSQLSWHELTDVLLSALEGRRPGWEVDEAYLTHQPPLWEHWSH